MIAEISVLFVLISYYYFMWPVVLGSMAACATAIKNPDRLGTDAWIAVCLLPFFIILWPWIPTYIAITSDRLFVDFIFARYEIFILLASLIPLGLLGSYLEHNKIKRESDKEIMKAMELVKLRKNKDK